MKTPKPTNTQPAPRTSASEPYARRVLALLRELGYTYTLFEVQADEMVRAYEAAGIHPIICAADSDAGRIHRAAAAEMGKEDARG